MPAEVQQLLSKLRQRIRTYVLVEGLCLALAWLGLTFWLALAIDYLPVWFGMSELPWQARAVLLAVIAAVCVFILYQWVLRRVWVRLRDQSMALLLERRFQELGDGLITSVESAQRESGERESGERESGRRGNRGTDRLAGSGSERQHLQKIQDAGTSDEESMAHQQEMLSFTKHVTESKLRDVQISEVFNFRPLLLSLALAVVGLLSTALFAGLNQDAFLLGSKRLYLLDTTPWPRSSQIELLGARIQRQTPLDGVEEVGQVIAFENNELNIARGTSLTLLVRALAEDPDNPDLKVPSTCRVIARGGDGTRGTYPMQKIGSPRDGFQMFTLDSEPFKTILDDIQFELRGGDHRIGTFSINIVDSPAVVQTTLKCEFPDYMIDRQTGRWTARDIPWSAGMELPVGTRLTIECRANKPLQEVFMQSEEIDGSQRLTTDGSDTFRVPVESLEESLQLGFFLKDADGVIGEDAHRIAINAVEDQPPEIDTRLRGIGTAVTPDVRIPLLGSIEDDYGTDRNWIEIELPQGGVLTQDFNPSGRGDVDVAVDFRERRQADDGFTLPTDPESSLRLVVKSQDRFNLGPANVGIGDMVELDVVQPQQLLLILDRSEVNQRKRLEQIYNELTDARMYLVKTGGRDSSVNQGLEPGDLVEPGEADTDDGGEAARRREIRLLFAQRATLQIQKSIQEISGVAAAFDDIRLQLINNRVDSEDRKQRLEKRIVLPLNQLAGLAEVEPGRASLTQLEELILQLELQLESLQTGANPAVETDAEQTTALSLEKMDDVLLQVNSLLAILKKFENQSELIEIVQRMLDRQKELLKRTQAERERKAFDGLLD